MSDKKVIIIAPSPYSLYSTSVYELLVRNKINVAGVIIKKFTLKRFVDEYKRDGVRLLKKIWKKLVLKRKAYDHSTIYNIVDYRRDQAISLKSLKQVQNCEIINCDDINSKMVERFIQRIQPAIIIFTGGGLIKDSIISLAGKGILNCHMGILPDYRGMDVVEWPILLNDPDNIGVTVHLMEKGVDTGPLLGVKKIDISDVRSFRHLRQKFEPVMCEFMVNITLRYLSGEITPVIQSLESGKQYFQIHPLLYKVAETKLLHYAEKKAID